MTLIGRGWGLDSGLVTTMISHQRLARICGESYKKSTFEEANIEVLVKGNVFAFRGTDEPKDAIRADRP